MRGLASLRLADARAAAAVELAKRLLRHFPELNCTTGPPDPKGCDIVINATPLGMERGDPMPVDVDGIAPSSFVGEVVMTREMTPFLAAAAARGCRTQIGIDMLYEQIPAYLEFFGFPTATPETLRSLSSITY
jgi:shikimate dehydrogenase